MESILYLLAHFIQQNVQRVITYFERLSITVQLTLCFAGLDLTKQGILLLIWHKHNSRIETSIPIRRSIVQWYFFPCKVRKLTLSMPFHIASFLHDCRGWQDPRRRRRGRRHCCSVWPDLAIYWTMGNFKALGNNWFAKSPTFLGNFIKVSKFFIFLVKSFLGNFYRHLAIFFWSHCCCCTLYIVVLYRFDAVTCLAIFFARS